MYFDTFIKGGLPVVAYAEYEAGYGWYVTGLYWRSRRASRPCGNQVPNSVYRTVAGNDAEVARLNREADQAAYA